MNDYDKALQIRSAQTETELGADNVSRSQMVMDRLRAEIFELKYLPREALCINEIAERMRVSSTPAREALLQLVGEGLVEFKRNKGFFVKVLSVRNILELYELCEAIIVHRLSMIAKEEIPAPKLTEKKLFSDASDTRMIAKELEAFYISLFPPERDKEILLVIKRCLAGTHVARRLILEQTSVQGTISDLYVSAYRDLRKGGYSDVIDALKGAFTIKTKHVKPAISSMVAHYML